MKITFLGAAGEVTGSQHLIETRSVRLLLDCGLFQGPRAESRKKNEIFRCDPQNVDAVILSHAHMDHCGNLPGLYKQGFRGPVFSTEATADIAELMLLDSAKIQQEDAKYLTRKLKSNHPPVEPLYEEEHVTGLMKKFEPLKFSEWHELSKDVSVRFQPAGHILGSAITELKIRDGAKWRRVVFTGDLGRRDMPLLVDPIPVDGADVLITECLYGNRVHPPSEDIKTELQRILSETARREGRVIIPAFSLGRTQQIVYFLNELFNERKLPRMPVFVDSPLANRLTKIFVRYDHTMDADVQKTLKHDDDVFGFSSLTYVGPQQESMALNHRKGPFVVISASGMCEGGRVVHHIRNAVSDDRSTICLMGYQAPHTLGWQIAQRQETVRIFDRQMPLNAHVEQLSGLSAHADASDFKWWFEASTSQGTGFGKAFLVHGEREGAEGLATLIKDHCDEAPVIPKLYESFEID
ncbi:MAG: MBL fold metallo-hydrolase [Planctomycetaceae bacterium]